MTKSELTAIRGAVADYMQSEGCSCCRNIDQHSEDLVKLAKLLKLPRVKNGPRVSDGYWYDFSKYRTIARLGAP